MLNSTVEELQQIGRLFAVPALLRHGFCFCGPGRQMQTRTRTGQRMMFTVQAVHGRSVSLDGFVRNVGEPLQKNLAAEWARQCGIG